MQNIDAAKEEEFEQRRVNLSNEHLESIAHFQKRIDHHTEHEKELKHEVVGLKEAITHFEKRIAHHTEREKELELEIAGLKDTIAHSESFIARHTEREKELEHEIADLKDAVAKTNLTMIVLPRTE